MSGTGLVLEPGDVRIWGMTGAERLRRSFARAGLTPVEAPPASGEVVLALGAWVYDDNLIAALAKRPNAVLVDEGGLALAANVPSERVGEVSARLGGAEIPADLTPLRPEDLAYNSELRKREPPVLVRLTADSVRAVEARTFAGSYKGVTDLVTKYWWPVPARIVTRWCAAAGVTPNQVTITGLVLTLAAFWLFWQGQFGLGLVCAWIMTFLDTVDGKLARVTLTSSRIGNVLDHGIDLIHPPFWWWAWWAGCFKIGLPPAWADIGLAVVVAGYVLQRVEEGIFIKLFGIHMHAWRPFDSWFRLITARRNPNLLLLTPAWALGRPDIGFVLVAVWTGICLVVHALQIVQGLAAPRDRVVSWLAR